MYGGVHKERDISYRDTRTRAHSFVIKTTKTKNQKNKKRLVIILIIVIVIVILLLDHYTYSSRTQLISHSPTIESLS